MISSPFAIKVRNVTRKVGLNKLISNILTSKEYEDRFGNAINNQIQPGDIVWDIGANLGIYTQIFLDSVSSTGSIVAFEPVIPCFQKLQQKFSDVSNVYLKNIGMGAKDEVSFIRIEQDPLAATHNIVDLDKASETSDNLHKVEIRSSDSFIASEPELIPNIIKIDVEGYEGQVIDGMKNLLSNPKLRCVGIEVHFGLLNDRGEVNRPQEIEKILKQNNFIVRWTDSSHILATR